MKAVLGISAMFFTLVLNVAPASAFFFSGCGILVQGVECILFQADSSGHFVLDNLNGFQVGDRVCVSGEFNPICVTTCLEGNGCIENNTILLDDGDGHVTDHFKCYRVDLLEPPLGRFAGRREAALADQFEQEPGATVLRPVLLCNPVSKNGESIKNPQDHLVCYKTKPPAEQPNFERREILVDNQFGRQTLRVRNRDNLLCVPSFKVDLSDR